MFGVLMRPGRTRLGRALVAIAAAFAVGLSLAAPAAAVAAGAVDVSQDGSSYGPVYPGALFDDIALLVPGDEQQQVFYVRNSGTESGFLRLTLRNVAYSDTDFADALTVAAHTAGRQGAAANLLSANPCWVLLEGQTVAPGAVITVTADLALGQLHGQAGQGATAEMGIGVELSDTSAGSLPPTACGSPSSSIPVVPSSGGSTAGRQGPSSSDIDASPPDRGSEPGTGGDLPVLNLPGGIVIDPNTWHLYEEWLVLVLVAAAALGTGWYGIVARRRRSRAEGESDVIA